MKLIEKFLIKRCSTEVQIMLERMKDRPEDFDYGTGWRKLVEGAEGTYPYTNTERKLIRKYWKECQAKRGRRQLLDKIMQQTINPTTREDMEDAMSGPYSARLAASMQATKQTLTSNIISGSYMDARAMYGNPLQNTHQP
jgi:hypothetical protein